jgi:hypothetical protein
MQLADYLLFYNPLMEPILVTPKTSRIFLKVPKCENFHRTDFFNFFTIKPLWVGDFRAKIKNSKF